MRFAAWLLVCMVPGVAYAQDVPECRTSNYLERFDPTLTSRATCDLIAQDVIRWNGHSKSIRAIHMRGTALGDTADFVARFHEAATAAGAAMSRMSGDIDVDDVTVLMVGTLSPRMSGPGWEYPEGVALALTWPPDRIDCPVSYYKTTTDRTGPQFVDALVHEMFHCIQYKKWGGMRDERWLVEGSAEYFVYLARPSRGPDDIQAFDAAIANQTFADMTYQAAPFFLWLGSMGGPPRVREFVFAPDTIERMVPLDLWTAFGEAYFDQSIRMPDGRPMPSSPNIGAQTVRGAGTLSFGPTPAYTLAARDLTFEEHKRYQITYATRPPTFRTAWRHSETIAWGDPPTEVVACDTPQRYRVMWGATRATGTVNAQMTSRVAESAVCTCPSGIWLETVQSTRRFFEQSAMGAFAGNAPKRYVGGSRILRLNADNTGSFTYDSVEIITGEGQELQLDQIQTGTSRFTWSIVNGVVMTRLQPGSGTVTLNNTLHRIFSSAMHETRTGPMQSIGHTYTCDAAGLHLTVPAHTPSYLPPGLGVAVTVNLDFVRIGG